MSLLSSKTLRLALTVIVSAGALSTLSGCTDDEVAASALVIGAAAIVAGGGDSRPDRGFDHHDHGGFDRGPRGGDDRGPRGGDDRGPGGGDHRPHALDASAASINFDGVAAISTAATAKSAAFKSSDARVTALANNYGISDYAATYLVRAIVMAQAKDTTGVKELGLKVADFKDIYDGRQLPAEKIATLASKLKMEKAETAALVSNMSADVAAEKAARGL